MKKFAVVFLAACLILSLTGCLQDKADVSHESKASPVSTMQLKHEVRPEVLEYIGTIQPGEVRKYSFKSPGKIAEVYVEKGDKVEKGSVLAKLDTGDLEYVLKAAGAQVEAAKAQYMMAQDSYNFAKDSFDKTKKLYESGAVSDSSFDEAKLGMDVKQSQMKQAKEVWNQANVDYNQKKNMLKDAVISSDVDGYITEILYKQGEMVPSGYPAVVVRSMGKKANAGVVLSDLDRIKVGNEAVVDVDGVEVKGNITSISDVPDSSTRTYNVEISLPDDRFSLGAVARILIVAGEEKGIWIPVSSIISGSEDYVFVVEEDKAVKKKVTLGNITGDEVKVEGLHDGQNLIIEGTGRLRENDKVIVQQYEE